MNTTQKPRRPRRPAGQRAKPVNASAEEAFEDGKSEVESLKEEIEEWKSNLECNNMEHLPKYEELEECHGYLEGACDDFEGIDFPECLSDVPVCYTQDTRQQAASRSGRLGNAQNALYAAKEAGEAWLEENPELTVVEDEEDVDPASGETVSQDEADQREQDRSAVEEFVNEMDYALGELDYVCFPGMY